MAIGKTTVKNTSGADYVASFLPPHGRTLSSGEEVEIDGDLFAVLHADRAGVRKLASLYTALQDGDLEIVSMPTYIAYDATLEASKTVGVDNGSIAIDDVDYGS